MCGILGAIGGRFPQAEFAQALNELAHRGPDDAGIYKDDGVMLGLRRLAILDLSPLGHQPMRDESSGAVITYNGEIYNYLELRKELESLDWQFKSATDTEVVLKSIIQWGDGALQKFNGMWAFAVWLPKEQCLFFARDRFGIKPFYYVLTDEVFAFASEPKALLKLMPRCRRVDRRVLYDFLVEGNLYTDTGSFYDGIKTLRPAHCGEYHVATKTIATRQYWNYPDKQPARKSDNDIEQFSELFDSAVALRLRSDVPLGLSLSGGLDSTAVLAAAQKKRNVSVACYTSIYSENDRGEARWARLAASKYGTVPIEVLANQLQWIDTLQSIVWHMDGPGYSPAVFPLWNLMAEARRRNTLVLLEGQGSDELLGGYAPYTVINVLSLLARFLRTGAGVGEVARNIKNAFKTFGHERVILSLLREMFPALVPMRRKRSGALSVLRHEFILENSVNQNAAERVPGNMDRVTRELWRDHACTILPGLLQYGDAISMAHGVESRLPFMDYRLVEWAFARPASLKIANGETKWVLRQFLRANGQERIAARMDKQGYPTPVDHWLSDRQGAVLKEFLLASDSRVLEFAEPAKIQRLIANHLKGRFNAGNHLYRLLTTELWLRRCVSG